MDFVEVADEHNADEIFYIGNSFIFYSYNKYKYILKDYQKELLEKMNIKNKELNGIELEKIYNTFKDFVDTKEDFISKSLDKVGKIYFENNVITFKNNENIIKYFCKEIKKEYFNDEIEINSDIDLFRFSKILKKKIN